MKCAAFRRTEHDDFQSPCLARGKHDLAGEVFCDEHYWKTVEAILGFLDDGYYVVGIVVRKAGKRKQPKHGISRSGVRGVGVRKFEYRTNLPHATGILQSDGGAFR